MSTAVGENAVPIAPAAPRTRRDRPCDACRRRKSKCVVPEGATVCAACKFHAHECTYVETPAPRKKRLNSGALEKEGNKRRSPEVEPSPGKIQRQSLNASLIKTENAIENGLAVHDASALKQTLGMQKGRHSQYVGWTTEFEPCLVELLPLDEKDESSLFRGTLRKVSEMDTFLMRPDSVTAKYEEETSDLDEIERLVGENGRALIDLYFEVVHPSFPILHKDVFLQRYARSYREVAPTLLSAVYILAHSWWHHSPQLASSPKPDTSNLERLALKCLNDSTERPKLSTVQAGLLLLQRPGGDSWVLTAQIVAIGQELGLNVDCSGWTIPPWERGLRRRLAWALYVQDKWSCLVHGRPSHIDRSNWVVQPLSGSDFPTSDIGDESGEEEDGQLLFTQMVALTEVLSEILETFYTMRAGQDIQMQGHNATRYILERAKPIQIKLKEWFTRLPACLKMDSINNSRFSAIGYLHLAYYATEIELHRLIVRSLTPTLGEITTLDPYLAHICRSAAKTRLISAMDFVNRLKPQHLSAFWHFASKVNFALIGTFGCLLWATAPGREEAEFYRIRLDEYRWTLRVSLKELTFMAFAAAHLHAATELLKTLDKPMLEDVFAARRAASAGASAGTGGDSSDGASATAGGAGHDRLMMDAHLSGSPGTLQLSQSQPHSAGNFPRMDEKMADAVIMQPFRFDPTISRRSSGLASPSTSEDEEFEDELDMDEDEDQVEELGKKGGGQSKSERP